MKKLVKKLIPKGAYQKVEPYGHFAEAVVAQSVHRFPARGMKIVGVTGTSGKTTTTTLTAAVLRAGGHKTAHFTTLDDNFGDGEEANLSRMTTIGPWKLLPKIKRAKANGCEWIVIETGSHALVQHRVWKLPYKAAVFTNLSHEHLDYHKTLDNYRKAKGLLFKMLKNREGEGYGIINADDQFADYYASLTPKPILFGLGSKAQIKATDIDLTPDGSSFMVHAEGHDPFKITNNLPGSFNVMNCLAATSVGLALGIKPEDIAKGIKSVKQVTGRMAKYSTDKGFTAVIDFAHTADSFEKIFKEFRPITKGKMIAVFGKAGERDVQSRYDQGEIAANYCERIILTEDDPRSESNEAINAQIKEGIAKSSKTPEVFENNVREDAIDMAVAGAEKGDVILLLSKGHEQSILLADGKEKAWDEAKALKDACDRHGIKILN